MTKSRMEYLKKITGNNTAWINVLSIKPMLAWQLKMQLIFIPTKDYTYL
jgi:hypothetical protein